MSEQTALLRCDACRALNRFPAARLAERPRCGRCHQELRIPSAPVDVTDATFRTEVIEWPGVVVVFFWAPWCHHCRGMMLLMSDLSRQRAGVVKVALVNTETNPRLAAGFSVMSVPRISFFRKGRLMDELNGAVSWHQLAAWVDHNLGKT